MKINNNFSFIFTSDDKAKQNWTGIKQNWTGCKPGKDEKVEQQFINTVRCTSCKNDRITLGICTLLGPWRYNTYYTSYYYYILFYTSMNGTFCVGIKWSNSLILIAFPGEVIKDCSKSEINLDRENKSSCVINYCS